MRVLLSASVCAVLLYIIDLYFYRGIHFDAVTKIVGLLRTHL